MHAYIRHSGNCVAIRMETMKPKTTGKNKLSMYCEYNNNNENEYNRLFILAALYVLKWAATVAAAAATISK